MILSLSSFISMLQVLLRFKFINFIIRKSSLTKILKNFFPFGFRKRLAKKIEQKNISSKAIKVIVNEKEVEMMEKIFKKDFKKLRELTNSEIIDKWF